VNNLNSVLIESNLDADPDPLTADEKPTCSFHVVNMRQAEPFRFLVITVGRLATVCAEYLKKGRGVRVVGSLHEEEGRVWIVAEHVEFKPVAMRRPE
jgi:single-strand DNA-binding protein